MLKKNDQNDIVKLSNYFKYISNDIKKTIKLYRKNIKLY